MLSPMATHTSDPTAPLWRAGQVFRLLSCLYALGFQIAGSYAAAERARAVRDGQPLPPTTPYGELHERGHNVIVLTSHSRAVRRLPGKEVERCTHDIR
jgi:hypothetical protein